MIKTMNNEEIEFNDTIYKMYYRLLQTPDIIMSVVKEEES